MVTRWFRVVLTVMSSYGIFASFETTGTRLDLRWNPLPATMVASRWTAHFSLRRVSMWSAPPWQTSWISLPTCICLLARGRARKGHSFWNHLRVSDTTIWQGAGWAPSWPSGIRNWISLLLAVCGNLVALKSSTERRGIVHEPLVEKV